MCPKDRIGSGRHRAGVLARKDRGNSSARRCCATRISASTRQGEPAGSATRAGADGDRAWVCRRRAAGGPGAGVCSPSWWRTCFYFTPKRVCRAARYGSEVAAGHDLLVAVGLRTCGGASRSLPNFGAFPTRVGRSRAGWRVSFDALRVPKAYSAGAGRTGPALWTRATRLGEMARAEAWPARGVHPPKHYRDSRRIRVGCYGTVSPTTSRIGGIRRLRRDLGAAARRRADEALPGRSAYRIDLYANKNLRFEPLNSPRRGCSDRPYRSRRRGQR